MTAAAQMMARDSDPPWLKIAFDELDTVEFEGPASNPEVEKYFAATNLGPSNDSVAWCKAFTNYCFLEAQIPCDPAANARAALKWGVVTTAKRGALCVLWRESPKSWQGHVGFLVRTTIEPDARGIPTLYVHLVGGNQNNGVNVSKYPASQVLGYRWPKQVTRSKAVAATVTGTLSTLATEVTASPQMREAVSFSETLSTVFQVVTFLSLAYLAYDRISKINQSAT